MAQSLSAITGANVRAELARRGISQTKLAEVMGLSQPSVSERIRGQVPFDINEIAAIAAFLEVPISALLPLSMLLPEPVLAVEPVAS